MNKGLDKLTSRITIRITNTPMNTLPLLIQVPMVAYRVKSIDSGELTLTDKHQ